MGLLDRIEEEESVEAAPVEKPKEEKTKKPRRNRRSKDSKTDEAPVVTTAEESPRSRRRRNREPRKPRDRVDRSLKGDFERAGTAAYSFRRVIDFIANVGWSFPLIFIMGSGSNFSPTYFLLGGLLITILNTVVLPIQFGRTLGNFTTRTSFVRHSGTNPIFLYHFLKAMFLPFAMAGLFSIQLGLNYEKGDSPLALIICVLCLLIVIADIVVGRIRKADRQGLWETAFLGVYLVKHVSSGESSGWLKRLESSGDFFESKGWGVDKDGEDSDES